MNGLLLQDQEEGTTSTSSSSSTTTTTEEEIHNLRRQLERAQRRNYYSYFFAAVAAVGIIVACVFQNSSDGLAVVVNDRPRLLQEEENTKMTRPSCSEHNNNSTINSTDVSLAALADQQQQQQQQQPRVVTLNIAALKARNIFSIVEGSARDYEEYLNARIDNNNNNNNNNDDNNDDDHHHYHRHPRVKIKVTPSESMPYMYEDIINDAKSGGGIFDGYFTNPVVLGSVSTFQNPGFLDLTPFIQAQQTGATYQYQYQYNYNYEHEQKVDLGTTRTRTSVMQNALTFEANPDIDLDWPDILLPFRKYVAQFEGKIYMLPLDGDIHSMYVRNDILDFFGLGVPRTWDEYNNVAKSLHGKVYNNMTLSGSCVSRVIGSHGQYWSHLILSSMTQTHGPSTGSMFDTETMEPLLGEAFIETLRILEYQALYGVVTEFDNLNLHEVHSAHMNDGTCASKLELFVASSSQTRLPV